MFSCCYSTTCALLPCVVARSCKSAGAVLAPANSPDEELD